MTDKFKEILEQKLADADLDLTGDLHDAGWEKKGNDLVLPSEVEDIDELAVAANVFVYKEIRNIWDQMFRNDGMTDSERERYAFFRNIEKRVGRGIGEAMKDMRETFDEIADEIGEKLVVKYGEGFPVRDVMSRIQFPQIMQRIIELPMMVPLEPVYVLQPLFKRISVPDMFGDAARFQFPILGALTAHELGEDAEVQEKDLDIAGGTMVAKFGKVGVGFKFSQDFNTFKNFDWFGLILSACRQALAREKERRAYVAISTKGSTIINNAGRFGFSGATVSGTVATAGTGVDGLRNGTHVLQDLFYMMTSFNDDGLMPDTIVLSPRAWLIWAQSPEMRAFAWQHGMPQLWQKPTGQFGKATEHEVFGGLLGPSPDHPRGSSVFTPPGPVPTNPLPMSVVVSPFVTSGTDSGIEYTDAHVLDVQSGIGYLMQAQEVMMSQWQDPEHDLEKIRFTERYAYGILQDSTTIRHMKFLKTREIGIDARDKIMFGVNWAGGVGGPHLGNV